jgi:PAS domain S-box-containing protein
MTGRFETLIAHARDLIATVDRSGAVTYCTPSVQHILGLPPAGVLGQLLWEMVHPEDVFAVQAALDELFESGAPRSVVFRMPFSQGGWRVLDAVMRRVEAGDGVEAAIAAVDVTETRRVEAALHERDEALRHSEKLEIVGRLAGGIAHDFGNLLTVITGAAGQMLDALPADSPLHERAQTIADSADRASALVRQLLAFGRPHAESRTVLDVNAIIRDAEQLLRRLLGEHIVLTIECANDLWAVKADRTKLEQVLLNLAVNARDAMPGGGRLTISTKNLTGAALDGFGVHDGGTYMTVSVADTGIGMDETTLTHMFKPFFTTKPLGHGTGLGLATVQTILSESGGWTNAQSMQGQGTTITFGLPRAEAASEPAGRSAATPPGTRGGHETLLVVEDEKGVRDLVRDILEMAGYDVLTAPTPAEAERLSREDGRHIHLLLTDIVMPEMSGLQLAAQLKEQRPELRIMYMSGFPEPVVSDGDTTAPSRHFLSKPFDRATLLRSVRAALDAFEDQGP